MELPATTVMADVQVFSPARTIPAETTRILDPARRDLSNRVPANRVPANRVPANRVPANRAKEIPARVTRNVARHPVIKTATRTATRTMLETAGDVAGDEAVTASVWRVQMVPSRPRIIRENSSM
jgi:hypothetical protein